MSPRTRLGFGPLAVAAALLGAGCAEDAGTNVTSTPPSVVAPAAPDEAKPDAPAVTPAPDASKPAEPAPAPAPAPAGEAPATTPEPATPPAGGEAPKAADAAPAALPDLAAGAEPAKSAEGVALVPVTYKEFRDKITAGKAKLTLVDAWATWCGPCKENFPHVLEMDAKYAPQGLKVISLSVDDPEEPKQVAEARAFLTEKQSTITNFLLNETSEDGFAKLNIMAVPAVFLYGPDGEELKRFTLDDPSKQFEYSEVEKVVAELLKAQAGG